MYWNNTWVNFFNKKLFFNKTLFFENIFLFLFSDKIFNFFFTNKVDSFKETPLFKKIIFKKTKNTNITNLITSDKRIRKNLKKKVKYNFTRVWFIKYNTYILLSSFVFFYFKVKKKKKNLKTKHFLKKKQNIFWKKKNNNNPKKLGFTQNHINF